MILFTVCNMNATDYYCLGLYGGRNTGNGIIMYMW